MRILIVLMFAFCSVFCLAQTNGPIVEGTAPNFYISHVVRAKESLYSLSRTYNVAPAAVAKFNNITLQTGLKIGQVLKMPLTAQNFDQSGKTDGASALVPLYHVVGKSETLFRLGNNYNKVPLTSIKQWNNLGSDNVSVGMPLIVGYLKTPTEQATAFNTGAPMTANTSTPEQVNPGAETTTVVKQVESKKETEEQPIVEKPIEPKSDTIAVAKKDAEPIVKDEPKTQPVAREEVARPIVKEEVKSEPVNTAPVSSPAPISAANTEDGFFATTYSSDTEDKKLTETNGEAATFKSTSGWQDKKYYALINNVRPGTILKVTADNRTIYARVLGSLPDMKENTNVLLRLSNSAASHLQKVDPKFAVQVSYYK